MGYFQNLKLASGGILLAIIAILRMAYFALTGNQKATHIALALDEAANASFNGSINETISSRAGRALTYNPQKKWACVLCKILNKVLEPNHCEKAYAAFLKRYSASQMVPHYCEVEKSQMMISKNCACNFYAEKINGKKIGAGDSSAFCIDRQVLMNKQQ